LCGSSYQGSVSLRFRYGGCWVASEFGRLSQRFARGPLHIHQGPGYILKAVGVGLSARLSQRFAHGPLHIHQGPGYILEAVGVGLSASSEGGLMAGLWDRLRMPYGVIVRVKVREAVPTGFTTVIVTLVVLVTGMVLMMNWPL